MWEKIKSVLDQAIAVGGSRKIKVTLKPEAFDEAVYLLGMMRSGMVSLDGDNGWEKRFLRNATDNREWKYQRDRTVTVTLTSLFCEGHVCNFMRVFEKSLEEIEYVE